MNENFLSETLLSEDLLNQIEDNISDVDFVASILSQRLTEFIKNKSANLNTMRSIIKTNCPETAEGLVVMVQLLIDMRMHLCKYLGETVNVKDYVILSLIENNIYIGGEICCLLSNGYAEGGYSLWRTSYESMLALDFLLKKDQMEIYQNFYNAHLIKEWDRLNLNKKAYSIKKLSESEIELKKQIDIIPDSMKKILCKGYGWTLQYKYFKDMVMDSDYKHYYPYYKDASQYVHSTPQGVFGKLGLIGQNQKMPKYAVSSFGFALPTQCLSYTLTVVSSLIAMNYSRLKHLSAIALAMQAMSTLINKSVVERESNIAEMENKSQ